MENSGGKKPWYLNNRDRILKEQDNIYISGHSLFIALLFVSFLELVSERAIELELRHC